MLENITLGEIVSIMAITGALLTYVKNAIKPIKDFSDRVDKIEKHQDNDNKRLEKIEQDNRQILKALKVLIAHNITGNNTGEMKRISDELDDYLINK